MSFRIEQKIKIDQNNLINFRQWLNQQKLEYIYPPRNISSLYFDNENLDMYKDSLEGVLPRKKIRIRNYPESNIKEFFLEKKISSQDGRFKTTDKIKENKLTKEIFDLKYGICKPIVTVSYLREYYKVDNFRLTLDKNLKFKKYSKFSYTKEIKSNKLSLEIKSNFNYPLDKLEEYFYFERIRFSKYCEGIDMIFNQQIR